MQIIVNQNGIKKTIDIIKDVGAQEGKPVPVPTTIDKETQEERPYKRHADDQSVIYKTYWFLNFTIGSVPWSNEVHHVLNQSSLNKAIAQYQNIPDLIIESLLGCDPPYNVNGPENMIILPTEEKITRALGLPTHGSHGSYSDKVFSKVREALSGFKEINADRENPNHDKPDPVSVRNRLIKISESYYKKIIDAVPKNINKKVNDDLIKVNDIK